MYLRRIIPCIIYTLFSLVFAFYLFLSDINIILLVFQLVFLYKVGLIRIEELLWIVRIKSYYRNVKSNCGSWLNSLCRTVTSVSRAGTEVRGQGIMKERWIWYGKSEDERELTLSPTTLDDVGDLWYKLTPFTTVPAHPDSECREAEGDDPAGAGEAAWVPRAVMQGRNCEHVWPYTSLPSINITSASLPSHTACTNVSWSA